MSWAVFFRKSWWCIGFCALTVLLYASAQREKKGNLRILNFRLEEMAKEKVQALMEKEDLHLRLASRDDPAWIEMILMRDLGVVPEGFLKVHFKK